MEKLCIVTVGIHIFQTQVNNAFYFQWNLVINIKFYFMLCWFNRLRNQPPNHAFFHKPNVISWIKAMKILANFYVCCQKNTPSDTIEVCSCESINAFVWGGARCEYIVPIISHACNIMYKDRTIYSYSRRQSWGPAEWFLHWHVSTEHYNDVTWAWGVWNHRHFAWFLNSLFRSTT